jgi:hypothetical protein
MAMSASARSRGRPAVPVDVDQLGWNCGFYPGTGPRQDSNGTDETFDQARVGFETAWQALLPTLTEADFDRWRAARDWTEQKYAMWERGEKLPSQIPTTMMACPCGIRFNSHDPDSSYIHRVHIYEAQATDGIRG